jgi:2',3'-cyclic-nucleotide 2'-phosphodiesterase (5'-nucleotidase family)
VDATPQTWVTANLRGADGETFGSEVGVRDSVVREVAGERIGLFGVTNPPSVRNDELAEAVDVDAVLGGHTHGERGEVADGTALTRPGARGRRIATVELRDATPGIELYPVPQADPSDAIVDQYREAFADAGLTETVDVLTDPIPRRPVDTYPESRIGNAVADAYRWVADADVALCNAKMLRAGPPLSGEVTLGDLRATTPFENDIWSAELSGEELRRLLEGAGDPDPVDTDTPEVFAHVSGVTLRWRRRGEDLELAAASVGGDPLDPADSYVVAAPTFAFLNDIFDPLARDRQRDAHGDQHAALAAYVREVGLPRSTDGRMRPVEAANWDDARSL